MARIPDEADLVRLAADGDQVANGRLYTHYYPQLYSSIAFMAQSHEDAQEIIHDTFLKIWKTKESLGSCIMYLQEKGLKETWVKIK